MKMFRRIVLPSTNNLSSVAGDTYTYSTLGRPGTYRDELPTHNLFGGKLLLQVNKE